MMPTGFEADTALAILAGGLVLLLAAAIGTAVRAAITTARLRRHRDPGVKVSGGGTLYTDASYSALERHRRRTAALTCDRCGGPLNERGACVFGGCDNVGGGAK